MNNVLACTLYALFIYKVQWRVISRDTLWSSSIKSNDVTDFDCVSARLADLTDSDGCLSENFQN